MVTHDPRAASRAHVERHLEKGVLASTVERHDTTVDGPGRSQRVRSVMKYLPYILKHLRKNWIRTASTVLGDGAVHLPDLRRCRPCSPASTAHSSGAATDRLVTRHRVSLVFPLPLSY